MPDKWAQYAQQPGQGDKWAQYAAPTAETAPTEPEGNAVQRAFDKFTTVTPEQEKGHSYPVNALQKMGAGVANLATPLFHPAQALERASNLMTPFDAAEGAVQNIKQHPWETVGGLIGGGILGETTARPIVKAGVNKIQNFRPTSSPEIVPPIQTAAEKLAGSIVPKKNQIPGFVNDIQRNAGNIRDFVKESNNPLRTQAEFEKAVQGAGNKRYEHFTKNILGPVADQPVPVPKVFGGETTGEGTATLGSINNRIGRLNQVMSPGYAKANPGDVATVFAKTPMETLQAEHAQITPAFHEALSQATGIPVEDIANLRQDFGSLRGLGNTVTEARAGRIGKVGAAGEGGSVPMNKTGVLEKVWAGLHGGQDAMANRALQKAWKGFEPLAGESRALPQSPENFQMQRAFQESANQEAARAEAARMHESEMAAQDAAAQRASRAQGLRQSRQATAQEKTKLEGESARTIGRQNALNQRKK